jgi:NAD(P)-dependent dehydrogenase (short-subunit alcohol dehydrogenase family)
MTDAYPTPPLPEQEQEPVGVESQMDPKPDYGEDSYRGSGKLDGKAALITGGDSGIGRAVALAFAREGADVAISYLDEHSDAEQTKRVVEAAGRRAELLPGDISRKEHCDEVVQRAVDALGRLDVLVLNAAYQQGRGGIADIPADELEHVFAVNVFSMFWLTQAALPHLQEGAAIITTSSIEAFRPKPPLLHYASTKGAVLNFTKGLATELTPKGIRVNSVAPGPVWTPLIPMSMPGEEVSSFGKNQPIGRPAQPAEVAPAYVFLASPESTYVSGATIAVTGGEPAP